MSIAKVLLMAFLQLIPRIGSAQSQAQFELTSSAGEAGVPMELWATHYFVYQTATVTSEGLPFRDRKGQIISDSVSPKDWCQAAIQGTVQVFFQGARKTLNFAGTGSSSQIDCAAVLKINPLKNAWIVSMGGSYFSFAAGPYGDGASGSKLVPYRTIAVDPKFFPFGTVLYVPAAKGAAIQLPDGTTVKHDGYFYAGDSGVAIKGNHIDVFCGVIGTNCFPAFVISASTQTFKAFVVSDKRIIQELESKHK